MMRKLSRRKLSPCEFFASKLQEGLAVPRVYSRRRTTSSISWIPQELPSARRSGLPC